MSLKNNLKIGKVVLMVNVLVGWAPPRASLTCVNCHNPHIHSWFRVPRWPARYNTQVAKRTKIT